MLVTILSLIPLVQTLSSMVELEMTISKLATEIIQSKVAAVTILSMQAQVMTKSGVITVMTLSMVVLATMKSKLVMEKILSMGTRAHFTSLSFMTVVTPFTLEKVRTSSVSRELLPTAQLLLTTSIPTINSSSEIPAANGRPTSSSNTSHLSSTTICLAHGLLKCPMAETFQSARQESASETTTPVAVNEHFDEKMNQSQDSFPALTYPR